jgi:hypothetical protein
MKTQSPPQRCTRGSTLMLTVVTMGLIGFVLLAYLSLVRRQHAAVARSQAWNTAIPVIEAGVEEALTHLNAHGSTNLVCDGWTRANDIYFMKRTVGEGYYLTIISNWFVGTSNSRPVIDSRGYISTALMAGAQPDWMLAVVAPVNPSQHYIVRGVRVHARAHGLFAKAMVAKGELRFNGGVETDSFDSQDPALSTNGRYDPAKTRDNGDVASNDRIVNAVVGLGSVKIRGHVSTGPKGAVNFTGNAAAGSSVWVNGGNSGVQEGWFSDDMSVSFDEVPIPFTSGYFTPSAGNLGGTNYTYLLGTGKYRLDSVSLKNGHVIMVSGKAQLYVPGEFDLGSQGQMIIAPGASLELTVGGDISLTGQGVVNATGEARNCVVYGRTNCTSIKMSGNSAFVGVIYAPSALFSLSGGGSVPLDFIGASITGSVDMSGNYKFHYDESLANWGLARRFTVTSWNEMTPAQVAAVPSGVAAYLREQ